MALATGSQFGFEAILIWGALWFFVLMRFGFLASVVVEFGTALVIYCPFTFEGAAWYSGYGIWPWRYLPLSFSLPSASRSRPSAAGLLPLRRLIQKAAICTAAPKIHFKSLTFRLRSHRIR